MKEKTSVLEKVPFSFSLEILKQTEEAGQFHIVGYAATSDFDLQGDIITEDALKNSQLDLLRSSTVLLNHDVTRPIGKVTKAEFDTHGLLIDVLISQTEPDIIQKIKEGVLNKFSIRGQVLERDKVYMPEYDRVVNVIKRMALVEVSLVSVPANPEAKAIGWYVSKALEDADGQSQGGNAMSKETVIEEIPPEVVPQKEEQPPVEKEIPAKTEEEKKPETVEKATEQPADAPAPAPSEPPPAPAEQPEVEKKKQAQAAPMSQLDPVWFLLDKLITMGGPAGAVAQQLKVMLKQMVGDTSYPYASSYVAPKGVSKEDLNKMISEEVKKQVEVVLKSVPTMRKGLIQPESEKEDVKKQYESLPPEKKLKVALALQQG